LETGYDLIAVMFIRMAHGKSLQVVEPHSEAARSGNVQPEESLRK
jgi:hypothetical protein